MTSEFLDIEGRVAIVTGGNSGIGLAIACGLAAQGAQVVIAGRREAENRNALDKIRPNGGTAEAVSCDVAEERAVEDLVAFAMARFGQVDIGVACAGGNGGGSAPLTDMDTDLWMRAIALNLDGVFYFYRALVRRMKEGGNGGSLIGISSIASIRATPSVHYAAAKGAVNAMTMNLAAQLGPHGIRVNAILPGMIETPATDGLLASGAVREAVIGRIPLSRVGVPDDIASLACYLASPRSAFMTGQLLVVDGGMSLA